MSLPRSSYAGARGGGSKVNTARIRKNSVREHRSNQMEKGFAPVPNKPTILAQLVLARTVTNDLNLLKSYEPTFHHPVEQRQKGSDLFLSINDLDNNGKIL